MNERRKHPHQRKHYLINLPLQLRYMSYILVLLLAVMTASVASMYYGIWGSVIRELSDEGIRNKLIIANRIYQYEKAREITTPQDAKPAPLNFIRETELLSQQEREIFKEILSHTNHQLMLYFIILLAFIGWGTIFLSHRIAGPLYRFDQCFKLLETGDLTVRAHLRKYDEAVFLAKRFNQMTSSLEMQISKLKQAVSSLSAGRPLDAQTKETLEKVLSHFKTAE